MLKKLYRGLDNFLDKLRRLIYVYKTWIWEWVSINSKRNMVSCVEYTPREVSKIDNFWRGVYGKKISLRWHKLYQSINGVFDEKYLPDIIFSTRIEPCLNPIDYARLYSDKGLTELLYAGVCGVRFPKTILLRSGGYFYDEGREIISYEQALAKIQLLDEFVIKPTLGGSSGHGVCVIDGDFDARTLIKDYRDDFIVQQKLKPHSKYSEIYSNSINTIRLITYIAHDKVHHAPVCLRIGTAGQKVDNIHSGGIGVGVSDEGVLLEWAYRLGYCNSKERVDRHPDTGITFLNYEVPGIPEIIEAGKRLHGRTPKLGVVSWDFMIDSENNVVLVEGNYFGQAVWFTQVLHGKSIFGDNLASVIGSLNK